MNADMLNISLPNALSIWDELATALHGTNGYGGTVAEIYAYRINPLSSLALTAHKNDFLSGPSYEALREESKQNGEILYTPIKKFQRMHPECRITVDGLSAKKALLDTPFVHRCHVEIKRKTHGR